MYSFILCMAMLTSARAEVAPRSDLGTNTTEENGAFGTEVKPSMHALRPGLSQTVPAPFRLGSGARTFRGSPLGRNASHRRNTSWAMAGTARDTRSRVALSMDSSTQKFLSPTSTRPLSPMEVNSTASKTTGRLQSSLSKIAHGNSPARQLGWLNSTQVHFTIFENVKELFNPTISWGAYL